MATEEGSGGGGAGAGEKKSSQAPAKPGAGGAGKFLAGLPWRGNFSSGSGSGSSNLGGFRVYVCEHSTDPPEGQVIKTDSTNILIRHLQLNKQRSEGKDADSRTPGENNRGKRTFVELPSSWVLNCLLAGWPLWSFLLHGSAARSLDVNNSAKRANLGTSSGSSACEEISGFSQHTLQSFTVERLRALLRQSGLSTKGKKDELITRLRELQG
ncbi:protein LOWER TEMPERATURE 1-like isoform X2 [Miscanthus floridulus]|uniref:protein LOWER TEMPERATURE 1-like isoform X2 n=1 Tax=Miscanthus floridulus TaxID=154761 RepID=UPI00345A9BBA